MDTPTTAAPARGFEAGLAAAPRRGSGPARRHKPAGRVLLTSLLAGLGGAACVWLLIAVALFVERGRAVDVARSDIANLARTMQESLDRRIEAIDARLRFAQTLFARDPEDFAFGRWAAIDPASLDIVQGALLTPDGTVRTAIGLGDVARIDLAGRPDLRSHMAAPGQDRLVTGPPVREPESGRTIVSFSRPVHGPDGSLRGLVVLGEDAPGLTRLFETLDVGPGGVALFGTDGTIRAAAPAGLGRMAGRVPAALLGSFADPAIRQVSLRTADLPDGVDRFVTMRRLEGQPLVVLVAREAEGALAAFLQLRKRLLALGVIISVLIALTVALVELKRASGRRARAELEALVANLAQGVIMSDREGRIAIANGRAMALLRLPAATLDPGRPLSALPPSVIDGATDGALEYGLPDGTMLEIRSEAMPDGGTLRTITDTTAQRRARDALAAARDAALAAEAALSAAIENVPQGIILLSPQGGVRVMNRRAAALLDLPRGLTAEGTAVADIVAHQRRRGEYDASPDIAALAADDRFGAPDGCPPIYERVRPDGRVLEVRTNRTQDGGAVRTITDITERKRAEREMEAARDAAEAGARARAEFLAVMSHEIRTPLNAVIGLSGLLQDATLPPEQAAHARLIREAGDHLLTLVTDILDFRSLESGRLELEAVTFDPRAEAGTAAALMEPQARAKALTVAVDLDASIPARAIGDPGRLRQVLLNLLNNAVKFTSAGSVRLTGRALPAPPGQVRLEFAVHDTGIGIPPQAFGQLFSPFRQVDASTSRRFGGTGLGLAISRQLVELMGGSIDVRSEPGIGSTFRFDIALRTAAGGLAAPAADDAAETGPAPRLRILLAEDNSTNRLVLTHRLREMGHETEAVSDGREALEAVTARAYDLIIMDMMMPGMDGLEATRAIRALPGPRAGIPIIGLTAAAMPEDEAACLAAGMDGYERKPIGTDRLRATIRAAAQRLATAAAPGAAPTGTAA